MSFTQTRLKTNMASQRAVELELLSGGKNE